MNINVTQFPASAEYPTWSRAREVVKNVEGAAERVRYRGVDDGQGRITEKYHSAGCGRGLADEIHDIKASLRYDPTSQDTLSLDYKHVHDEGFHREHTANLQVCPDGSKLYTLRTLHDWTSLVSDRAEVVKVAQDGTMSYSEVDHSPKLENFLRQNRALERVGVAFLGGAVAGGLVGYAAGPVLGALAGSIGAMAGNAFAREGQSYHRDAPHGALDMLLMRYADKFTLAVNVAGAASAATLALLATSVLA